MSMKKLFLALFCASALFASCDDDENDDGSNGSNQENQKKDPLMSEGHEYVDLGLSVGWATVNLGATSPEGTGSGYFWGELDSISRPHEYSGLFDEENPTSGINYDIAGSEFDIAHKKWGGDWQMPTKENWQELIDNCTFTWKEVNGVFGYEVKSKKNDNTIFLPAAGDNSNAYFYYEGKPYGSYWTSTSVETDSDNLLAYEFTFTEGSMKFSDSYRRSGDQSIRPVLKK